MAQTFSFYDRSMGMVTTTVNTCGFFCKLFGTHQQTFVLSKSGYKLGETVTATSSYACFNQNPRTVDITLNIDGPNSGTQLHYSATASQRGVVYDKTVTFVPMVEGTYHVTHSWECDGDLDTLVSDPVQTFTVVRQITSCPAPKFVRQEEDYAMENQKPHAAYFKTIWEKYTLTSGTCVRSEYAQSYMTVCNNDYVVQGTDSETSDGYKNCVLAVQEQPSPLEATQNQQTCNGDISVTCNDGSTVVAQKCVNGNFQDTGSTCPIGQASSPQNASGNQQTGTQGTQTNDQNPETPHNLNISSGFITFVVIAVGVILVVIVLVVIRLRRKK